MNEADSRRLADFHRMRRVATGMLVVMFLLFFWAHTQGNAPFWVRCLRAFAEAAMVGALADWFAVTALFRHPLGLPIPHTAIIPRGRDRIAASIGSFVSENFLERAAVGSKLEAVDPAGIVSRWLASPANAERVSSTLAGFVPRVLNALADEDVDRFLHVTLVKRLSEVEIAPTAGRALRVRWSQKIGPVVKLKKWSISKVGQN